MTSFPVPNRTDLESLYLNRQKFPPAAGFSKVSNNFSLRKLTLSHLSRPTLENLALSRPTQSRPSEIGRGNYAISLYYNPPLFSPNLKQGGL